MEGPVAFSLLITIVAFAIERYARPPGGLHLPPIKESDVDLTIHLGSPKYPREAIDRDGFRVRIPSPAHRIVSQYHSIDEFVYSIVPPEREWSRLVKAPMKAATAMPIRLQSASGLSLPATQKGFCVSTPILFSQLLSLLLIASWFILRELPFGLSRRT